MRTLQAIAVLVFPVASMLTVGLSFTLREIAGPLRHPHKIFRALVANFVLVPLLAYAIARLLHLSAGHAAGLMLAGTAAGSPFALKLTHAAKRDAALSATLIVLLTPVTVVVMPLVIPLVVTDVSISALAIATPLFVTMIVPLIVGLVVDATLPRLAAQLRPIGSLIATIALVALVTSTLVINAPTFVTLIGSGAITAAVLLIVGAFLAGYLMASPGRRGVLGLGTAQRNIAAAMVVAARDFADRDVLVVVVVLSVIDLLVLFPIAWAISPRAPALRSAHQS